MRKVGVTVWLRFIAVTTVPLSPTFDDEHLLRTTDAPANFKL